MRAGAPTLGGYQIWSDLWVRSGWRVQQSTLTDAVRVLNPAGRIATAGSLDTCMAFARASAPSAGRSRAVVLLHGIGRGRHVMRPLDRALADAGWAVANVGYPSLRRPLAHHADAVGRVALALHEDGARTVALVAHSLGGLIARTAASHAADDGWPLGRMVLIGSPARGSAIADGLKGFAPYRMIAGDCGQALTPLLAAAVPVPETEIAVIAGGNGANGYNPFLAGDNDGVVTVAETRLPGAEADFLRLPSIHTTLPMRRATVAATIRFLETGHLAADRDAGPD
jgi:pimeloyl-ACP methyl ester carboxylesterase